MMRSGSGDDGGTRALGWNGSDGEGPHPLSAGYRLP